MKKLNLKNLKLEANDMLQRNQLKTIFGGDGGYGGSCPSGECTNTIKYDDGYTYTRCNTSSVCHSIVGQCFHDTFGQFCVVSCSC